MLFSVASENNANIIENVRGGQAKFWCGGLTQLLACEIAQECGEVPKADRSALQVT